MLCNGRIAEATSLGPGDVAFTTVNSDGVKQFSFVLLTDIQDSTGFYITDNEWSSVSSNWYNTSEGIIKWYYNGPLSCGTEVRMEVSTSTVSHGVLELVDGVFNPSTAGDALLMYEGTTGTSVTSWITGIKYDATGWTSTPANTTDSDLPAVLTDGVDAISFSVHRDNWIYDCSFNSAYEIYGTSALFDQSN